MAVEVNPMNEILKLDHIQKFYGNQGNITKAINDISFSVSEGEFVGIMGASGSGKTRFWLTPQLLQAHSSYVVVDPKGGTLAQCGYFLQRKKGYKVRVSTA